MVFIRDMSIIDQAHYPEVNIVIYNSILLVMSVHFYSISIFSLIRCMLSYHSAWLASLSSMRLG